MTATIYILCDSREVDPVRRVRYVGQTRISIDQRLRRHWITALADAHEHRAAWMRSVKTRGGDVRIEVVAVVPSADADAAEAACIAKYRALGCDLTNRTDGGRGRRGWDVSSDTRRKMSESAKRRQASAETRRRMSEAIRASASHREHLQRLHRLNSRPCPPETRRRISQALRGEGNGQTVLTWRSVEDIRRQYASGVIQSHLARAYGCSPATIHRVVHKLGWVRA